MDVIVDVGFTFLLCLLPFPVIQANAFRLFIIFYNIDSNLMVRTLIHSGLY